MIRELVFRPDDIGNADDIKQILSKSSGIERDRLVILKSFIDARRKPDVKVCYRVSDESLPDPSLPVLIHKDKHYADPKTDGYDEYQGIYRAG